jgi:hypothetical protein
LDEKGGGADGDRDEARFSGFRGVELDESDHRGDDDRADYGE